MSQPRQLDAMATYLITRRVILQYFLLRPDTLMNQIILYLLAAAARRHGVQVHAVCVMSTHLHLVVTDVRGVLPDFLQSFHRVVARCTQVLRGWKGGVWDKEPTSLVRLRTPAAVVEEIAYVLANPVAAGVVRHAHEWPGVKVLVNDIGKAVLRASRPGLYLNPKNPEWAEEVTLPISLPPSIDEEHADAFRRQVAAQLARLEAEAQAKMREEGKSFLGAEQAMLVPHDFRPENKEPEHARNPTLAVGHEQGEALTLVIAAVRAFRTSYRVALKKWRGGDRSAVFPAGTWWMRVFHDAVVNNVVMAV